MCCCFNHTIDYFSDRIEEIPLTLAGTEKQCFVNRVLDGDTIEIIFFNPTMLIGRFENIQKRRFRLEGIDDPELHSKDEVEKEHALKSKIFLEYLILHKVVKIKFTKPEKYGREMGIIYLGTANIIKLMLEKGMAREYHGEKKEKWNFN